MHFEIIGRDPDRLRSYYAELFGWEFQMGDTVSEAVSEPSNYGFVTGSTTSAGTGFNGGVGGGEGYERRVLFYVGVSDVETALRKAEDLGGARTMGPEGTPETLVVGHFTDPEGNLIGVAGTAQPRAIADDHGFGDTEGRDAPGRVLRGSCACGATQYEVEDAFVYAMNCHCSRCRAATGSAYKPMGGIEREKLRVTRADVPMFIWGEPDAGDFRCGVCGSFLYSIVREGKWAHVTFGSLVDAPSRVADHHVFVASKAPWDEIRDELPKFDAYPE